MLNLASRSALCFGIFCALIFCFGMFALRQTSTLSEAEKKVEENIVPSFKVLGLLDREFMSVRNSNSKLRNAAESELVRSISLKEVVESQGLIRKYLSELAGLVVTPQGQVVLASLGKSVAEFELLQKQYLSFIAAGDYASAIKYGDEEVRNAALKVASSVEALRDSNDAKAKAAGEAADAAYNQTVTMVFVLSRCRCWQLFCLPGCTLEA
ncbi:MCP four helix bundle domain-containing protein [Pseudomonas sp. SMN5]|uniref:MCP four helix bundle domain-containing protein n=1 Tax=Pseudomonas sp. SMN5 TaxID=3390198 RepID=UPI003F876826